MAAPKKADRTRTFTLDNIARGTGYYLRPDIPWKLALPEKHFDGGEDAMPKAVDVSIVEGDPATWQAPASKTLAEKLSALPEDDPRRKQIADLMNA